MTVRSRLSVDGREQVELFDDRSRAHVEFAHDVALEFLLVHDARTEGVDVHANRLGNADGIGELDLTTSGQARRHDVLRDVTCIVGGGAIDLGRILAAEGTATMAAHAAVGIDDDLATCETRVTHRPADDETTGRVHEDLGLFVHQSLWHDLVDDQAADRLGDLLVLHVRSVLRRDHDRLGANWLVPLVLEGDL